ncbi:dTMP kinase [Acidaminobacter sp. JC074]|uniref:dTMP kinase n=1 Tax=Acidaminobacter sp. JC074 TaxID=2530199 RepID=UPI001F110847|nr:dTMP kinase [Acidaminobacter sp. JC074]MCH4889037.1 dTMP kinase [Acidaminobacter sp. JC074]
MSKGYLISLEGGEGAGKTTILEKLEKYFQSKNIEYITTREPGGVHISEQIREIILDKDNVEMDPKTEALLFAAARRQHLVQKVVPALEAGKIVFMDRYVDSSLIYQGYVRGMGVDEVFELNQYAIEDLLPDVTLYFDLSPEVGLGRINKDDSREVNRLDLEEGSFHHKVREGYLMLKDKFERFEVIDAEKDLEAVFTQVIEVLVKRGVING